MNVAWLRESALLIAQTRTIGALSLGCHGWYYAVSPVGTQVLVL
jgi:hypothetical protein